MLQVPAEHRAHLRTLVDAAAPRECCGLLLGSSRGATVSVTRVVATINTHTMPGGFAISDREIERARRLATQCGAPIVAVFHSHPGGTTDSSDADRHALAHSEWPWVVITESARADDVEFEVYEEGVASPASSTMTR